VSFSVFDNNPGVISWLDSLKISKFAPKCYHNGTFFIIREKAEMEKAACI